MKDHVTNVFQMEVLPGKLESFKEVVKAAVAATQKEPGTLIYEYSFSDDGKTAHIVERYQADSVVSHVDETFAPFAQPFNDHVRFVGLTVYGNPDAETRKRLDPFGAVYLKPFAGFDRLPD
jgi:quinol monooxygenase YgiN